MSLRDVILWASVGAIVAAGIIVALDVQKGITPERPEEVEALIVGGRNYTQYMGRTGTTYTGNLGSIAGANAKCNSAYSGSHMCTQSETIRTGTTTFGGNGWISCTLNYNGYQGIVGPTYYWRGCGNPTASIDFAVSAQGSAGSCTQWASALSSVNGTYMDNVGNMSYMGCNNSLAIHCCK